MKNIYSITAILFLAILALSIVSSLQYPPGTEETDKTFSTIINFKKSSNINMALLGEYCSEDFCKIFDTNKSKFIIFKIDYEDRSLILDAIYDKENNFSSIHLIDQSSDTNSQLFKSEVIFLLKLMITKDILSGVSNKDIEEIGQVIESSEDFSTQIYFKEGSCGDSYFKGFDETGDVGKSGWLNALGSSCSFTYEEKGCPRLICNGDFFRGELRVVFEEGVAEQPAKILVENLGLEINEIDSNTWEWADNGVFIVGVPEGEEKQWIETLEGKDMVFSANLHMLAIGGINGATPSSQIITYASDLIPLKLNKRINSDLIYWLLGLAVIVAVLILFLVFRKKH